MVGHLGLTPLSTESINERITLRAADTKDPASHAVFFEEQAVVIYTSFSDGSGKQWGCAGAVACLARVLFMFTTS